MATDGALILIPWISMTTSLVKPEVIVVLGLGAGNLGASAAGPSPGPGPAAQDLLPSPRRKIRNS